MTNHTLNDIIKQSSIAITALSVLFYFWGYSYYSFVAHEMGIPLEFLPDKSIQDYLLRGGYVGLLILTPIGAIVFAIGSLINVLLKGKISRLINQIFSQSTFVVTLAILLVVVLSVALIQPIATIMSSKSSGIRLTIKSVVLNSNPSTASSLVGLCYVSKKGQTYIFADTLSDTHGRIHLIQESELKHLELETSH